MLDWEAWVVDGLAKWFFISLWQLSNLW